MTEKSRFRVKKLGVPEYAAETAGVFCGPFPDGTQRKLSYGKSYRLSEHGSVRHDGVVESISFETAKDLEKLKFGKRE